MYRYKIKQEKEGLRFDALIMAFLQMLLAYGGTANGE